MEVAGIIVTILMLYAGWKILRKVFGKFLMVVAVVVSAYILFKRKGKLRNYIERLLGFHREISSEVKAI